LTRVGKWGFKEGWRIQNTWRQNKMTECKIRDYEEGDLIPSNQGMINLNPNIWYPCEQPDELDDKEFNTVVFVDDTEIVCNSIDFEFRDIV
jgi:hypothetical protein